MAPLPELQTARLRLRLWRLDDRKPFAAMNADPNVMAYFPAALSELESDALIAHVEAGFQQRGFGFWAVEVPHVTMFAGFIGLSVPRFETHFTPCVEIGWRLAAAHWNKGYATEGAQAALAFGFETLQLNEIVAFTTVANAPSRRVMEKIGMIHDAADDFDHPLLPEGHHLQRHVLYRCRK